MQIILFLLALFAIGYVLYGISAGVQTIARGFTRLTEGMRNSAPPEEASPISLPTATAKTANDSAPEKQNQKPWGNEGGASPIQRSIDELREIFALYQQGALTQAEFEGMKRTLLAPITQSFTHTSQKNP